MRIATWNVNSLRVRLPQLLEWLRASAPDVVALQETKLGDDAFPAAELLAAGYQKRVLGPEQLQRRGLALAHGSPAEVMRDMPGYDDPQRRVLAASIEGVRVVNLYVPNGQSVGSDKYFYKLGWLRALRAWLRAGTGRARAPGGAGRFQHRAGGPRRARSAAWVGSVLVSPEEREALQALMSLGLIDVFRKFEQPARSYSAGGTIEPGLSRETTACASTWCSLSVPLTERCTACTIDREPRRVERASDHTPVIATFDI